MDEEREEIWTHKYEVVLSLKWDEEKGMYKCQELADFSLSKVTF